LKGQLDEAKQRCKTIVGDDDAHWLIRQIELIRRRRQVVPIDIPRQFHFLSADAEVVLNHMTDPKTYSVIEMPAGGTISKQAGTGFRDWVFRVSNGLEGADREYFDLAYRQVAKRSHVLYLKTHRRGDSALSGRRAGNRYRGRGPDRSL
jgi:hypothetical protein